MPFVMVGLVGPRYHELDDGMHRENEMQPLPKLTEKKHDPVCD